MNEKTKDILLTIAAVIVWMSAVGLAMWIFSNDADAETEKKPKIEHVYSLITWYDKVPPYTNEFIWKTERKCLEFRASINGTLESYKDDPKFGWIGECTKRERP